MKKIYAAKPHTPLVPQPRSLGRLVKQLFNSILKRQGSGYEDGFQSEVIQQLKNLEEKIEAVTHAMARQAKRKR